MQIDYRPSDGILDEAVLQVEWRANTLAKSNFASQTREIPVRARVLGQRSAKALSSEVNFGYTRVGEQTTRYLPLENTSTGNATVTLVLDDQIAKSESLAFLVPLPKRIHLNPGQKFDVPVIFAPTQEGIFHQKIAFFIEGSDAPQIVATLLGTSISKRSVSLEGGSEGVLDFGTLRQGQSAQRTAVLRNVGNKPMHLRATLDETSSVFQFASGAQAPEFTLAPMESTPILLTATPKKGGVEYGSIHIVSFDEKTSVAALRLSTYSLAPKLEFTPTALRFPPIAQGWTAPLQRIYLVNWGVGTLVIQNIQLAEGSSPLMKLLDLPPLPIKIEPGDKPIVFLAQLQGSVAGNHLGQIIVQSNSIDSDLHAINLTGSVQGCSQRCAAEHASSQCITGSCEIALCEAGWHDTDRLYRNGCECREDRLGHDVGGLCSTGLQLGWIGDSCSSYPHVTSQKGTLHGKDDVDLYFISTQDTAGVTCDLFTDSHDLSVSLVSAPPGLVLCVNEQVQGAGCGGYKREYDERLCGTTHYFHPGSYGKQNSADVTAWVMWHPDVQPSCGEYEVEFRAKS
jgi:hypothetical protein